ncbi:hypothetical protein E2C01_085351 [Portunus trituberculatus]|uniref:Uncharacterized protein n=1 Tax=Portunus trituberculatus TaxID=210409 RepID=A0A5B7J0R5_PORTR|nr:hypothetical protein [Portunus trituberculatus]
MTKRHRGSGESLDLTQPKQSKVSCESSRDRSARIGLLVLRMVFVWRRLMILSQLPLVDQMCQKVHSSLTLVLR